MLFFKVYFVVCVSFKKRKCAQTPNYYTAHLFYRTPKVAASVKACNITKIRLFYGCFFVNFLKISERFFDALQEFSNSLQKYWQKNVC